VAVATRCSLSIDRCFQAPRVKPVCVAVSFDLFGTLVAVAYPSDPAAAVAAELRSLGVTVPDDWHSLYGTAHIDAPSGAEVPLPAHVSAALKQGGVQPDDSLIRRAVINAFDPDVETAPGAQDAIEAAGAIGPVGLLSNCSVPELVARTLIRSDIDRAAFDAIVTSVACGWRKPDCRAFEAVATQLECTVSELTHVGDTDQTDGGIEACGGRYIGADVPSIQTLPDRFEAVE